MPLLPAVSDPLYFGFLLLTFLTLTAFYLATGRQRWVLLGGGLWLLIAAGVASTGFFAEPQVWPPRLALLMVPMLIGGLYVGFSPAMRGFRAQVSLPGLHFLHAIRVAVEVMFLHGLYEFGSVAREVTYEGYNLDVFPGFILPAVGWLVFRAKLLPRGYAVAANIIGIAVLGWTILVAIFSTETPFQLFGFDQPTYAIFYFPWVWLPALVAPLMLWAHFITLGRLRDDRRDNDA